MEVQEEVMMGSKEHTLIVKGKRTKRTRPQSPIPFAIITNSSSDDRGGSGSGGGGGGDGFDGQDDNNNHIIGTILSPTTSNEFQDSTDQEEEDMANCLILLAQGQSRESPKPIEEDIGVNKFNSRRYLETANPVTGKVGYIVYECKTCNRTFPSFQALGGHRASHKKTKAVSEERKQFVLSDDEEGQFKNDRVAPLSLQLGPRVLNSGNKPKVHECSICGAEFTSGQALGGHMRRHRAPMSSTNTALSLTTSIALESDQEPRCKKARNVLSLDLNLPAPEDDHRESKFLFASKQQEQQQPPPPLVFSAPALVDCHY